MLRQLTAVFRIKYRTPSRQL